MDVKLLQGGFVSSVVIRLHCGITLTGWEKNMKDWCESGRNVCEFLFAVRTAALWHYNYSAEQR